MHNVPGTLSLCQQQTKINNMNHLDHYYQEAGARTIYELNLTDLKFQLKHCTNPNEKERIEILTKLISQKENLETKQQTPKQ